MCDVPGPSAGAGRQGDSACDGGHASPTLTWVSDIVTVIQAGLTPIFVDIDTCTLGMDPEAVLASCNENTRAVFITHVLGYNALNANLLSELKRRGIPLIEDVCESHGATFQNRRLGSFGVVSNFSFYYAHHMSTIEGGMVCTNDDEWFNTARMLRSHGMTRECPSPKVRGSYATRYPDLNPDFIFALPAYNVRSTELNAVLGRSQLKRLDENNLIRRRNLDLFLKSLDSDRYFTEFETEGSCNYALTLLLREPNDQFRDAVMDLMRRLGVEFRRGMSGGGNQVRQPYLRNRLPDLDPLRFPKADHVHFYGFYIGNYPELETDKILSLCTELNSL